MNRTFLRIIAGYFLIALPLVWMTDLSINDQDDHALMRLALYTPIVASSLLMALFAVWASVREHRQRRSGVLQWPPEWDFNVAGWAATKAQFFIVLWIIVAGWHVPEWVLLYALAAFTFGHIFFTAQWLGPAGSRTHGSPES
jgi:hypothetical protein